MLLEGQGEGVGFITHKNDREKEDCWINIVNVFYEKCLGFLIIRARTCTGLLCFAL